MKLVRKTQTPVESMENQLSVTNLIQQVQLKVQKQKQPQKKQVQKPRLIAAKCVVCGLLMALVMSNPFFNYHIVVADDTMQKFAGSENAENAHDFDDDKDQNAWKVYSVMRSYGMNHDQAVGVVANVQHESADIALNRACPAIGVDHIAHGLEGEKGNAYGQRNLRHRKRHAGDGIDRADQKSRVFEQSQRS